jgi:hypothetical protein
MKPELGDKLVALTLLIAFFFIACLLFLETLS